MSRVLIAVLVYDGRAFVPDCLESVVAASRASHHHVDVLVLDDCSPDPGWSEKLADLCQRLEIEYYRSPRNLGIPRNMNLALLRAASAHYDHVVISNSDIVVPENLVDGMVEVAATDPRIGSVTAWSNNVSIYSIPNDDAQNHLHSPEAVSTVSAALAQELGPTAIDIPTGVGFCLLIPVPVARVVGHFDPVFGRGYCEEVDWCRRSRELGFRVVLAPSVFVYHRGGASTRLAGLLEAGHTTVWAHERIVDLRHPEYRAEVAAFADSSDLASVTARGRQSIVYHVARTRGWSITATWLSDVGNHGEASFVACPDRPTELIGRALGFSVSEPFPDDVVGHLTSVIGRPPSYIRLRDNGGAARQLAEEAAHHRIVVLDERGYPERV